MSLNTAFIKSIKPLDTQASYDDGNNLNLVVLPNGHKHWAHLFQNRYISIGTYPKLSLESARTLNSSLESVIKNKIIPIEIISNLSISKDFFGFEKNINTRDLWNRNSINTDNHTAPSHKNFGTISAEHQTSPITISSKHF